MSSNSKPNKRTNQRTRRIQSVLEREFDNVEVYQYNSASVRVRVIDERFRGKSNVDREELVAPLLAELSDADEGYITVLLLIAPEETESSMMNAEFEHPTPSRL